MNDPLSRYANYSAHGSLRISGPVLLRFSRSPRTSRARSPDWSICHVGQRRFLKMEAGDRSELACLLRMVRDLAALPMHLGDSARCDRRAQPGARRIAERVATRQAPSRAGLAYGRTNIAASKAG